MMLRKITPLLDQRLARLARGQNAQQLGSASFQITIQATKTAPSALDTLSRVLAHEADTVDARLARHARAIDRVTRGVTHLDGKGYIDGCGACFDLALALEEEARRSDAGHADVRRDPTGVCTACGASWRIQRRAVPLLQG